MLVYLEAAGLLTERVSSAWHLAPPAAHERAHDVRQSRLKPLLRRVSVAVRQAYQRHRLIRELSRKSDHLLADIGITRSEIPAFAAAAVIGVDSRIKVSGTTPRRLRRSAARPPANDNLTEIAA